MGDINHEAEAWDSLLFHDDPQPLLVRPIHCKYCRASPLYWGKAWGSWRLIEGDGLVHTCKQYKSRNRSCSKTC